MILMTTHGSDKEAEGRSKKKVFIKNLFDFVNLKTLLHTYVQAY